jgi:hypothetical protein
MSIESPAVLDGEADPRVAETKSAQRALIETALAALFAAASVLLVSFLAVIQAVA